MANSSSKQRGAATQGPLAADAKVVRELAKILHDTGLTEIEIERGDLRVRVVKEVAREVAHAVVPAPAAHGPVASPRPEAAAASAAASHPGAVASPMVGTAYLAPDPKSEPFIKLGQPVAEGDTLVLIEAMKTFNPIPAPCSGKVVEIRVEDGQPVEFGEVLVVIE